MPITRRDFLLGSASAAATSATLLAQPTGKGRRRILLRSFKPDNPSRWAVRDLFIAQMAVTDRAVHWSVKLPAKQLTLNVRAILADQEVQTLQTMGVTWWEGAVEVTGAHRGRTARGRGHLEMSGYATGVLSE